MKEYILLTVFSFTSSKLLILYHLHYPTIPSIQQDAALPKILVLGTDEKRYDIAVAFGAGTLTGTEPYY